METDEFTNERSADDAKRRLAGPATGLIVSCGISHCVLLLGLVFNLWFLFSGTAEEMDQQEGRSRQLITTFRLAWNLVMQVTSVFILVGAMRLRSLRSLAFARIACIVSLIPCVGPCFVIGIPFGIWGLVVLKDPEVKSAFGGTTSDEGTSGVVS